eukprot:9296033-Pyramimonas_sp.AAC.1
MVYGERQRVGTWAGWCDYGVERTLQMVLVVPTLMSYTNADADHDLRCACSASVVTLASRLSLLACVCVCACVRVCVFATKRGVPTGATAGWLTNVRLWYREQNVHRGCPTVRFVACVLSAHVAAEAGMAHPGVRQNRGPAAFAVLGHAFL